SGDAAAGRLGAAQASLCQGGRPARAARLPAPAGQLRRVGSGKQGTLRPGPLGDDGAGAHRAVRAARTEPAAVTGAVAQAPDLGVARRRSGLEPVLLFGGTFDPVHLAHLAMAREALACMGASRLVLVPAGNPPHRPPPGADARHRTRMLALACAGDPRLQIDNREIHREGPSYSVLTLGEYRAEL